MGSWPPVTTGEAARSGGISGSTGDLAETARQVLSLAVPRLADAGAVYVLEPLLEGGGRRLPADGGQLIARSLAATVSMDPPARGASGFPAATEFLTSEVVAFTDATPYARCLRTGSPVTYELDSASLLAAPLTARGEVTGMLLLARSASRGRYRHRDVALATGLAAQTGLSVENARLYAQERRAARALQRGLRPLDPPLPAGLDIAHRSRPAGDHLVGGDWYDIVGLPAGRTAIVVGDTTGHGPEAAAVMLQLRAAAHALADLDLAPDMLLRQLNRLAATVTRDMFATCVCATLDQVTGECVIARAGHLPPVVAFPGGAADVIDTPPGLPLGMGEPAFHAVRLVLPPGAVLALYTDGLVENRTRPFDEGIPALSAALARVQGALTAACDAVIDSLGPHSEDDTTLVLARIPGPPSPRT